ncbi:MAG: Hsp70 family protein [Planctomycetota bacterium]
MDADGNPFNDILIRKNDGLPVKVTKTFTLTGPDVTAFDIVVLESEREELDPDHPDIKLVREGSIVGIPAGLPQGAPVDVTFEFREDGTLSVRAVEKTSSKVCELDARPAGAMTESEISKAKAEAAGPVETAPVHSPPVGIDLGATWSSIAAVDDRGKVQILLNAEGELKTPSVVMFEEDNPEVVVGKVAMQSAKALPDRVIAFVRREIGQEPPWTCEIDGITYHPEDISSYVLRKLKQDAEVALGGDVEVKRAVITVPAYFEEARRIATKNAGELAGLEVMGILDEPVAAAIGCGLDQLEREENVVIYDLGSSALDVTLIRAGRGRVQILAKGGNGFLGGKDWDEVLVQHAAQAYEEEFGEDPIDDPASYQALYDAALMAKESLSRVKKARITASANKGRKVVEITRDEFDSLTAGPLEETKTTLEVVLQEAEGIDDWSQVDKVLLVGGATKMPQVPQMVQQVTGKEPLVGFDQDSCVAVGAAIWAAREQGMTPKPPRLPKPAPESPSAPTAPIRQKEVHAPLSHASSAADPFKHFLPLIGWQAELREWLGLGDHRRPEDPSLHDLLDLDESCRDASRIKTRSVEQCNRLRGLEDRIWLDEDAARIEVLKRLQGYVASAHRLLCDEHNYRQYARELLEHRTRRFQRWMARFFCRDESISPDIREKLLAEAQRGGLDQSQAGESITEFFRPDCNDEVPERYKLHVRWLDVPLFPEDPMWPTHYDVLGIDDGVSVDTKTVQEAATAQDAALEPFRRHPSPSKRRQAEMLQRAVQRAAQMLADQSQAVNYVHRCHKARTEKLEALVCEHLRMKATLSARDRLRLLSEAEKMRLAEAEAKEVIERAYNLG